MQFIHLDRASDEDILSILDEYPPNDHKEAASRPISYSSMITDDLLRELKTTRDCGYAEVREKFRAINRELTARGKIPPSLRGLRRIQPIKKRGAEDTLLMHDLQVIDLDWLHAQHRSTYSVAATNKLSRKLTQLCSSEEFSEELAAEIADTASADMQKCDALVVSKIHQPELALLRTNDVRERMDKLMERCVRTERDIRALAERNRYARGNEESWAMIWGAAEWLKLCNLQKPITGKQLADAYVAFGGAEIKPASAINKLRSVRKLLGEQLEPHLVHSSNTPEKQLDSTSKAATSQNSETPPS